MFERYRTAFMADQDAPGGGGTPPNAGVNAGTVDVNELVNQVVGKRVKKEIARVMESLPSVIETAVKQAMGHKPADPTAVGQSAVAPANTGGEQEQKLTLKALHEQIATLTKGIDAERQGRAKAEENARSTRIRSEVESNFTRHLGAESPHLVPYLGHFLPQFQDKDGSTVRKVVGEFGEEKFVAAKDAVDELFKNELKHLLPARNANVPPARVQGTQGTPYLPPKQAPTGVNPLMLELAEGLALGGRPELAQAVYEGLQSSNGTAKK